MAKFSLGNEFSKNNIETDVPVTKKTSKYSSFLEEQISEPINQAASSDSKRIKFFELKLNHQYFLLYV